MLRAPGFWPHLHVALDGKETSQTISLEKAQLTRSQQAPSSLVRHKQSKAQWGANLIRWIASGDETAFRLFYNSTNGLLFGLLLRILGHTQTAEEVLSELYDEVRQKAARFGSQNERPLTWLIFIAHRRAIERLCRTLTVQSQASQKSTINITEERRLIRAAMDSIPHLQQQTVEMAFFSGMTKEEIAKELGQSPESVEADLQHAMLRLFGLFTIGFTPANGIRSLKLSSPSAHPEALKSRQPQNRMRPTAQTPELD